MHNPQNFPLRVGRDGKFYPYHHDDPTYLSKSPVGFRECFKYGKTDNWMRRDCPMGNSNEKGLVESFFKELKIHKSNYQHQDQNREKSFTGAHSDHHNRVRISQSLSCDT